MSMELQLPDGTKFIIPNGARLYTTCLENFHTAVNREIVKHNTQEQDIFSTITNIERHTREYDERIKHGLYGGCRQSDMYSESGKGNEGECFQKRLSEEDEEG